MSKAILVQESEFKQAVIGSDIPVLVDFFAPWCGPCRSLAPALDGISAQYEGRLKVVKVNVDEAPSLATTYNIRGVPTLMFFKAGEVVETFVGVPAGDVLRQKMDAIAVAPKRPEPAPQSRNRRYS